MGLSEQSKFYNKRVVITGAAGGLGSSLCKSFHAAGAYIIAADRDAEGLERLASGLGQQFETHIYNQADIGSMTEFAGAIGEVDVLVNNAGALLVKPIVESSPQDILSLVNIDLVGPMVLTHLIAPRMIEKQSGVIMNVSSQLAFCGAEGRSVYAAAKAGLSQFTKSCAAEFGPSGVRVLAIAPGRLLTSMATTLGSPEAYKAGIARVPVGRYGTPGEIADIVLFLCSPACDYIVGETIIADGGYVIG